MLNITTIPAIQIIPAIQVTTTMDPIAAMIIMITARTEAMTTTIHIIMARMTIMIHILRHIILRTLHIIRVMIMFHIPHTILHILHTIIPTTLCQIIMSAATMDIIIDHIAPRRHTVFTPKM